MFSLFLSSYRNTRKSFGELEKAVETLTCESCSHSISRSPKLPLVLTRQKHGAYFLFLKDDHKSKEYANYLPQTSSEVYS